ncbi:MAG: hypothetical protein WD200_03895 [Candidatus Andersenbacteria bacterium]
MQFVVLALYKEDQGDPGAVAELFSERAQAFKEAWMLYVSGSSYIANYTGLELTPPVTQIISWIVIALAMLAIVLLWRRKAIWLWIAGLMLHLGILLYIIDRLNLRYFTMFVLGLWILAGLGVGAVVERFIKLTSVRTILVITLTVGLSAWTLFGVFIPFVKTGGSVNDFSLGNRTNTAADLADTRSLIRCLEDAGPVYSENIHIWNRLQYVSHTNAKLTVLPEDDAKQAKWLVHYRRLETPGGTAPGDLCPELSHFRIVGI